MADDKALIFDIGEGKYDHHQNTAEIRENGNKYAAFGLLWRDFGYIVCPEDEVREVIDKHFIQPLDLSDNFGYANDIASMISSFNPTWKEENADMDACFHQVVLIAMRILDREITKQRDIFAARDFVEEALNNSDGEIVFLEKHVPWKKVLVPSTAKFMVAPSNRGGFSAQTVPVDNPLDKDSIVAKCDFPEAWGGLRNKELVKVSGIEGLTFCHKALFYVAAETKEAAMEACRQALMQKKE